MHFTELLQQLSEWMKSLVINYGYLGIVAISLIGALSIFFPIPYTVVIFTIGGLKSEGAWLFEPLWIALAAGTGSAVGEFSGYLLGLGGRKIISGRYKERMEFLVKVFDKFGPVTIFIFALTPLPDDLLFIPLGVMRYSVIRAFIPAFIGKVCMNFIVAHSGRLSIRIIEQIFGVESDWVSALIGMVLAVVLLVIVFVIMFRVNWEKHLEGYLTEEEEKGELSAQES